MSGYLERFRGQQRVLDFAVFLFALAVTLVQLWIHAFGDYGGKATDPDLLGFALALLATVPLLWRRRHPWVAMALAGGGGIALVACGYSVHVPVALMVALYTFAAAPVGGDRSARGPLRWPAPGRWSSSALDRLGAIASSGPDALAAPSLPTSQEIWPPIAFATILFGAQAIVESAVLSLSIEDYLIPALLLIGAWVFGERQRTAALRRAEQHERRQREERLSIAEERTRIARELHDSAGHAINTIRVQAGAARVLRDRDPERSAEAIEAIERLALETIEEIDRIVGSLRGDGPAERAPLPGFERIPELVAQQRDAGFEVELREQDEDWRPPPPAVGRAAYRIAQEGLTNAARYGNGRCELTIRHHVDRLEMTVVNTIAAESAPRRRGGGLGLLGMRERAQLLGGSLEAGAESGRFRVRAVLPYGWVRE